MTYLLAICRWFTGFVLCAFGFMRGIDAMGFSYKIAEYFKVFHIDEFELLSLPAALIFCAACTSCGVGLLLRVKLRTAALGALLLSGMASAMAYYAWHYGVVHACVCFGDIFETGSALGNLYARILVMFVSLLLSGYYTSRNKYEFNSDRNSTAMFLSGLACTAVGMYGTLNLPLIDFRPYKTGVNILQSMSIPEDAPQFEYATVLYYRNNQTGLVKEFTEDNYPWRDTVNWTYQHMKNKMVKQGYQPPITDFMVKTEDENDITLDILSDTSYNFLLVAADVSHSNLKMQPQINRLYEFCKTNGYHFRCLTASTPKQIARFKIISGAEYEFCIADATVLKTMITSNPGLLLLKNGVIVNKWHYNNLPPPEKLITKYGFVQRKES
ncbi:hypothetical protein C7N43_19740 [Sphingobacteriales bacterium UPWRP_1]|nr:hypothetical protein B6N25_12975 [Sphingobacteriales bacterium TSM_CSS]PSJ75273.1 hypothetical protein C7N43_19740 [Sphingobacteriales bacterium UPWRP_1]